MLFRSSTNGASRVVCYNFETNTIGKNFVGFAGALQVKYSRVVKVGELHKFNAEYTGSGAMENGKVLHQLKNETSSSGDTQSSSVDNGASSADGGAGYLQLYSLTLGGYDNLYIYIRDSADDITFADNGGFAANVSSPSAVRITIADRKSVV